MSGISGIGHSNGVVTFNMNNTSARQKGGDEKKTLFAGDMNLNQDGIFARKHRAQKEALKILTDVMDSDIKTDEEQAKRLKKIHEMTEANETARLGIQDLNAREKALMEEYGITEDSEEYKDLELIRRANDKENPLAVLEFSEEEQARYKEIKSKEYTDFQTSVLKLDIERDSLKRDIADNLAEIEKEETEYEFTEEALLKNTPMTDARKQSDDILEAARQDTIAELYNQVKENMDKKAEEEKEKQEKISEEKNAEEKEKTARELKTLEREIIIEKAKAEGDMESAKREAEAKANQQIFIGGELSNLMYNTINSTDYNNVIAEQEINKLLDKMSLLNEDIKGTTVDDTV